MPNVLDAPRTTDTEPLRRRAVGLVAAVLLIAGCSGPSAPAPRSAHGGLIAFTTTTGIHVVRADGTGLRWLTRYSGPYPPLPAWSPDGSRIAFDELQPGKCECRIDIYVVRADGSGRRRLTRRGLNSAPAWSPDGKLIAFDGSNAISVVAPDGSGERRLTPGGAHGEPVWSPDGKQIALSSNRDGDFEVYVMNADGGPQRQLTHNTLDDVVQDWQSLHDLRAPSVKALTSRGTPGKAITLRFNASDNSGRASVGITVFLGKRPVGYLHTPLNKRSAGHAYTATWRSYKFKGQLRFCVEAYDPSGNESSRSCAPIVTPAA